jgi:hypothetical protein
MRISSDVITTLLLSILLPAVSAAQNTRIDWHAFTMGYGGPVAGNTVARSGIGQHFIGVTRQSNTQIVSGFLANTLSSPLVVGVQNEHALPLTYSLAQNYPNPFNPTTTIRFEVPAEVHVALKVYNVLGQEVLVVVDEVKQPGRYDVRVEASALSSGAYFYRLRAGDFVETRKFVLLR